ncbi:FGGY carbohydrate kinase domain-containing protein [Gracilariopsis chorda]|uniref:FGGY carbohydrate kinase domain-containing protein n=1 Tax=Gracilariopsis chorda TaxID=448386 RepID=A0A2V3J0E2_9FLOR|nr:FGGY carbohydrate kinase domain-containing protein [Gracilariopsis chorda]|eukprot:PXF47397.1 FGGY carbohydrate kinase domain-containing protein [Gracilariopsis chorda]
MSPQCAYLAIDVGTGSVRAGLFNGNGKKLAYHHQQIKTRHIKENHFEQSSNDIWTSTLECVRNVVDMAKRDSLDDVFVAAIGVDATCSLVACLDDDETSPLSVTHGENEEDDIYNVILWLDHRAVAEAAEINVSLDENVKEVRSHFGNVLSPENEPPKLLWLQKVMPHVIESGVFFDLADWMAFKFCGAKRVRSSCTVACKWGWGSNRGEQGEWNCDFWEKIGLGVLCANNFQKIGATIVQPGQPIGTLPLGLASELGLSQDCVIASPMIDAHAGALWTLGIDSHLIRQLAPSFEERLSIIAGTSTCYIQLSRSPVFVSGIWGPFRDAVLPGFHVTEGGQSVTGKLLEHTIETHPCYATLVRRVGVENVYDVLAELTESVVRAGKEDPASHVHCLDYHAGNRSPRADPTLKGSMIGLTLSCDEFDLAVKFRATIQALCYGARHIVEKMKAAGHYITLVGACGGLCKSRLFLVELADCLALPIALSSEEDTVLLGGAILAKVAHADGDVGNHAPAIVREAERMTGIRDVILPNEKRFRYHNRKYEVYQKMYADFISYRDVMLR